MARMIILLTLLLNTTLSFGMCVTKEYDLVAWNDKGNAAIIHDLSYGPEGGGSDSYEIVDFENSINTNYTFSSDFSDGATMRQAISIQECQNAVIKVNAMLTKLDFRLQFNDNCWFHSVKLLSTNSKSEVLEKNRIDEISKQIGIKDSSRWPTVAFSKDGVHFIVIESNNSCSSRINKVIYDDNNKLYKLLEPKGNERKIF